MATGRGCAMPTLEYDSLSFRFPSTEPDARFTIEFQRTLRIPDTKNTYPLPAGLVVSRYGMSKTMPTSCPMEQRRGEASSCRFGRPKRCGYP